MTDHREFESCLQAFEQAWRQSPPSIRDFLPTAGPATAIDRLRVLTELICIDLEHRWKHAHRSTPRLLDDYLVEFVELGALADLPAELIAEEYRVRHRWGDRPGHQEYTNRFGHRAGALGDALGEIDQELCDESHEHAAIEGAVRATNQRTDPRAPLAYSDYRLERLVGAGHVGKVYRAWQRSLERPVAVKYLRKTFQQQPEVVERFLEEARTVARLRHPGVVGVHGVGRTPGGGYFIVMELVEGPDLARLCRLGTVAIEDAIRWVRAACPAVQHAHENGIVHCDLKPGNLLLDSDGRVRVSDFGLARSHRDAAEHRVAGTAPFMAPEQVSEVWGPIGPRTDVYGLGATLFTLLTGQPPWPGTRRADVLAQVVSAARAQDSRLLRPEIPQALSQICQRCLAKVPNDRYRSVLELDAALAACSLE